MKRNLLLIFIISILLGANTLCAQMSGDRSVNGVAIIPSSVTTTTLTATNASAAQIIVGTETVASLSATTLQSGPATFTGGVSLGGNSLTASGGTNIQYYSSANNPVTAVYKAASYSTKIQDVLSEFDGVTCTFKTFGKYSGYVSAGYYDTTTANTNVKLRVMKNGALYRTGQTALSAVNIIGEVVIPINDYFNANDTLSAQTYTTTSTGLMVGDLSYTSMFVIIKDH